MRDSSLAVLGGFGLSLGDGVIGLQALHAAQSLGLIGRPRLYRQSGLGLVDGLYRLAADMAEVSALPAGWPPMRSADLAGAFDRVIDMRDFALNPGFRGVAMIDFFLRQLGIDPMAVPARLKRNGWLAGRGRASHPERAPPGYVLVCPGSSMALRDMPVAVHHDILRWLLACQDLPVLTQGDPGDTGAQTVAACVDIETLLRLVGGARAIVSTDTAMVHLADALDVPTLAFFVTHRPQWRVRDYPGCSAVHWPAAGLPEALEFSRGAADLAAAGQAWARNRPALPGLLDGFLASINGNTKRKEQP